MARRHSTGGLHRLPAVPFNEFPVALRRGMMAKDIFGTLGYLCAKWEAEGQGRKPPTSESVTVTPGVSARSLAISRSIRALLYVSRMPMASSVGT